MRSKIKVEGKWYRPVPWMREGECDGCAFNEEGCINIANRNNPCDDGREFAGHVLIPIGKESYEQYLHKLVLHKFDKAA